MFPLWGSGSSRAVDQVRLGQAVIQLFGRVSSAGFICGDGERRREC